MDVVGPDRRFVHQDDELVTELRRSVRHRRSVHDEDGSIIIIVMAFLLVIGVIAIALLSFSFTATKSMEVYRTERIVRSNAESALVLAVERLRANPTMATDATSTGTPPLDAACNMNFPMDEDTSTGARRVLANNSVLKVTCGPTTTVGGPYGVQSGSGGIDADTGQRARDVTITITCQEQPHVNVRTTLSCGSSGGTSRVVAKARVRYEIDTTVTDKTKRAIVPKIVFWDIKR